MRLRNRKGLPLTSLFPLSPAFCFLFFVTGSHHVIQASLEIAIITQAGHKLMMLLPQLPRYEHYRHVLLCLARCLFALFLSLFSSQGCVCMSVCEFVFFFETGSHCGVQSLNSVTLLPQLPEHWNHRHAPLHPCLRILQRKWTEAISYNTLGHQLWHLIILVQILVFSFSASVASPIKWSHYSQMVMRRLSMLASPIGLRRC